MADSWQQRNAMEELRAKAIEGELYICEGCKKYLTEATVDDHDCPAGGECGICGQSYDGVYHSHLNDCPGEQ